MIHYVLNKIFLNEIYYHQNQNYDMERFDDDVLEMNNDDLHLLNYLMMMKKKKKKILYDEIDDEIYLVMKMIFLMKLRLHQILDDKKYFLV